MSQNPSDKVTRTLYDHPGNPATRSQPRAPNAGARFYGFSSVAQEVDSRGADLWATTGATQSERRQTREMFVDIARTGVPEGIVVDLARKFLNGELAAAKQPADDAAGRGDGEARGGREPGVASGPAREVRRERWRADARACPPLRPLEAPPGPCAPAARSGKPPDIVVGIAEQVFSTGWR